MNIQRFNTLLMRLCIGARSTRGRALTHLGQAHSFEANIGVISEELLLILDA